MNKSIRIIGMAALVLLLAVSCKKEKQDENRKVTLSAGIVNNSGKHHIEWGTKWTHWDEGDVILVNNNEMVITQGWGSNEAQFTCDDWHGLLPEETILYAISPATEQKPYQGVDGLSWKSKVTVPQNQDYLKDNVQQPLPMGVSAMIGAGALNFQQLTNVYCLPVYFEKDRESIGKITKVEMIKNPQAAPSAKDNDIPGPEANYIAGEIWYPHQGTETELVEVISGSESITLNCKTEQFPDGIDINGSTSTNFHFVAFPVQMKNGITFKFYTADSSDPVAIINKSLGESSIDINRYYTLYETLNGEQKVYNLADHLVR